MPCRAVPDTGYVRRVLPYESQVFATDAPLDLAPVGGEAHRVGVWAVTDAPLDLAPVGGLPLSKEANHHRIWCARPGTGGAPSTAQRIHAIAGTKRTKTKRNETMHQQSARRKRDSQRNSPLSASGRLMYARSACAATSPPLAAAGCRGAKFQTGARRQQTPHGNRGKHLVQDTNQTKTTIKSDGERVQSTEQTG